METETQEAQLPVIMAIPLMIVVGLVVTLLIIGLTYAMRPFSLYMTKHGLCSHPYESLCHRPTPHHGQPH